MIVEFHSAEKTEGYGAVSMLMGSWLAGEVGSRHELLASASLTERCRRSQATSSRTLTSTCNFS
jgi:hypothetical protein